LLGILPLALSSCKPPAVEMKEAYTEKPEGPTVDHSLLDEVLGNSVSPGGWVNYRDLKKNPGRLDRYLKVLEEAPFDELGRSEKLALLINGYNAFTLKLILEHYPIDSIKDIPSRDRWDARRWKIGKHTWSLNDIEHRQIRPKFKEPRIHFALVCAAAGCPPLRGEAYRADRLDEQLRDQARYIHSHARWFQLEETKSGATLGLTSLYRWYRGDFEQAAGSVLKFAAAYSPRLRALLDGGTPPDLEWLEYDWSLNSKSESGPGKPSDSR